MLEESPMRALCGAIITAGALIGLGLAAMGIGTRYASFYNRNSETGAVDFENSYIRFKDLDNPMKVCVVVLVGASLVGLAITFVGLAFHHERRYRESLRDLQAPGTNPRITV